MVGIQDVVDDFRFRFLAWILIPLECTALLFLQSSQTVVSVGPKLTAKGHTVGYASLLSLFPSFPCLLFLIAQTLSLAPRRQPMDLPWMRPKRFDVGRMDLLERRYKGRERCASRRIWACRVKSKCGRSTRTVVVGSVSLAGVVTYYYFPWDGG